MKVLLYLLLSINVQFLLAADPLNTCGIYTGALSTRNSCTASNSGIITFAGKANIYNNPTTTLATCTVSAQQWILDQTQTCDTADCTALPGYTQAISINYNNPPSTINVTAKPYSGTVPDITVNTNMSGTGTDYDNINYNWSGHSLALKKNNATLNINSINQMTTNDTLSITTYDYVNIGTLQSSDNPGNQVYITTPYTIAINQVSLGSGSTVQMIATSSIKINSFTVGRSNSNVLLKAPSISLNSLTVSNSGSGQAIINIYADTLDIGTLDMGQGAIVNIYPYTSGGSVTFRSNTITASSSSTLKLSSGDYYTKAFNIPGTSNSSSVIVMDSSTIVNLYINGNFAPGNNPGINSAGNNGNFGSLPATTMRIFINGDFITGGGGTTVNAIMYVEGNVVLGSPTYIKGAISASQSISLYNQTKIYYDSSIDGTNYSTCTNPPDNIGSLDVVDNYLTNGYSLYTGLKTKISHKSGYTLDAVWLGTNNGTVPVSYYTSGNKNVVDMPVLFYYSTVSNNNDTGTCSTQISQIKDDSGNPLVATFHAGDIYARTSQTYTMLSNARKATKIIAKFINFYGMNIQDSSLTCLLNSSNSGNIQGMPQCVNSATNYEKAFGATALASCRTDGVNGSPCLPSNHGIGTGDYAHIYGCYQCTIDALSNTNACSTDAFAIRPNDFNTTLSSQQQFIADKNTSITFYANQYSGTGTADYNETMNISFAVDVNISDNTKTCAAPSIAISPIVIFSNGQITNTYNLPNIGDFNLTIHEIPNSEYAIIDADDTPDSTRYISPYTQQITVVPDHFLVEGNLTNGSNGFTYLSNFETYPNTPDRNISAKLDLNITAKSFLNNTTSNYTKLCYAKDGNITLATNTTGSNLSGLSKLLWYDAKHDLNGSVPLVASSSYVMDLNKTQFDSATTNGMSESQYLINFNRAINQTVDPFTFLVTTVSTKNEDNRTGSLGLNQNALYYYGRVYSTDYRGKSSIPATIRYEAYCGSNCTTFGLTTQSPLSVTWYQNPLHVTSDGNVTQFSSASIGSKATTISNSTMSTINNGLDTTHSLSNTNAPYTDRIEMTPSAWLIYNAANTGATTNDFNVEFIRDGNWTGQGKLGKTIDVNSSIRTNKRMEW